MERKSITSFVIGSSVPVFLPFFYAVGQYPDHIKRYSYKKYSILAPLYFGCMNVIATLIGQLFNLTLRQRLLIISIISPLIVGIVITYYDLYKFDDNQKWYSQYLMMTLSHIWTYHLIIYGLESLLGNY